MNRRITAPIYDIIHKLQKTGTLEIDIINERKPTVPKHLRKLKFNEPAMLWGLKVKMRLKQTITCVRNAYKRSDRQFVWGPQDLVEVEQDEIIDVFNYGIGEYVFICSQRECKRIFTTNKALKKHKTNIHIRKKPSTSKNLAAAQKYYRADLRTKKIATNELCLIKRK